jgi:hypothetical protein
LLAHYINLTCIGGSLVSRLIVAEFAFRLLKSEKKKKKKHEKQNGEKSIHVEEHVAVIVSKLDVLYCRDGHYKSLSIMIGFRSILILQMWYWKE